MLFREETDAAVQTVAVAQMQDARSAEKRDLVRVELMLMLLTPVSLSCVERRML